MLGIVLVSHGKMAEGMVDSAKMLFGEYALTQVRTITLLPEASPEAFDELLAKAVEEVDSGDGVVIMADLLGGTPCNRSAYHCMNGVQVIAGMNLPLLIECLNLRMNGEPLEFGAIVTTAAAGLVSINKLLDDNQE